ncbi:MAG: DUF4404 family protein [Deltaproteobacteria bacterium]|nr:DUF4404 family protein [Deltaproteobacteria bacterium]
MPKAALRDLLTELQSHLEEEHAPLDDAERALLKNVHDDIEGVLQEEPKAAKVAETRSLLEKAAADLSTHPLAGALQKVADVLSGAGV